MAKAYSDDEKFVFTSEICDTVSMLKDNSSKRNDISGRCPICLGFKKYFHCANCIRSGDFTHSKKTCFDRFCDKKLMKCKNNEKLKAILLRYDILLSRQIKAENLKKNIIQYRERIFYLGECIKHCKERLSEGQKFIKELSVKNNNWIRVEMQYKDKIVSMENIKKEFESSLRDKNQQLSSVHCLLKNVISQNSKELVTYIFPISKLELPKISSEGSQCAELEEARQTTYLKGQWVLSGSSGDESQYSVVEPCIPGNGDYSPYISQCTKCADSLSFTLKEQHEQYMSFGIIAALTYTAHLVSVLAFYLDVHLPKPLRYSEFCGPPLEKEEFLHKVAKLNANIVHLCLSQNIDQTRIHPHQTIPNLLLLLEHKSSDLRCFEAFQMNHSLMEWIENSISRDLLPIDESESKSCDDIDQDWVKISDIDDVPIAALQAETFRQEASFISSVASFWRAATGQK